MPDHAPPPSVPQAPSLDERALARALSGHHLIGGALVPARSGKTFAVVNPATGEEVARAAEGDAADVEAAVADAAEAQKAWARTPARKRGALVGACAALLTEHIEELGRLIALETGKALRTESRVEAGMVADIFAFFGGLGGELKGESVPFAPDVLSVTVREPLGRRRRDHPVERADAADGAEGRARASRRQHGRREVGRGSAARRAAGSANW